MGNRVAYLPAYEAEVEYLESTGTQWIDTGVKPTNTTKWELDALLKKADVFQQMGSFLSNPYSRFGIGIETSGRFNMSYGNPDNITNIISDELRHLFVINALDKTWTIDDTSGNYDSQESIVASMPNLYLFARGTSSGANRFITNGRIYKSKIWDNSTLVRDFIPVRIGTTGYMYDKVSMQLFANAGTGRFVLGNDVANATVPQLRHVVYFGGQRCVGFEKVYERKQWLIAEIPKGTYMLYLPVNSSSFEFKCKFFTPSNCGYFSTEGYSYYKDSGAAAMKIWSSSGTYGWESQTKVSDGDLIEIISSPSETTINGESVPQKNFPITDIKIYQATNATRQAIKHISSITVDGIERYIPVKLLRSIPSKYDANGIARNAGECGMYDTVNDLFYGNVASSGTFSVSDD